MRFFTTPLPILIPTLILTFSQGLWASPLFLKVGEVRSLPASPSAVIRVGTRGVIRVVDSGQTIQVVGLKPGVTAMAVDATSYMVHVARSSDKNFFEALRREIVKMKGLRLITDTQPLEIHGTLLRLKDWLRIAEIARENHGQYVFKAQALPDAATGALLHLQKLAKARGLPILRFTATPHFSAHIPVGPKSLMASAQEAFGAYGIRVQSSESQLTVQPLIRTQVVLAEINRSHSRAFGIGWPATHQAQLLPKASIEENIMVTLKALEAKGEAQVLASPNLICRSGSEARFHAGGEFPVRVVSRHARDIIWKQHGVILKVRPKADFAGALSIEIETEVSLLDMAHSVDGVPALKINRVKSHFDLTGKRTIALSGLIRHEVGRSREGIPLLGSLPILGPLFSSRQFMAEQSEMVVFVTPEIQSPDADTAIAMPKGWVTHEW